MAGFFQGNLGLVVDISISGEGGVSLSWSDLGANFVYTVEYCDSLSEGNWAPGAPTEPWPIVETSWTDAGASGSGTRFYRIQTEALNDPPSPPGDVAASVEDGKVVITWEAVPGASSYNVYWSTDAKFSPLDANKEEDVTSPFGHTGLDYGVPYFYVVTAVGNKGESEVSSVVSITLAPPLDATVATTLHAATEFLYTGDNPIQTGVSEGTIEPKRAAVLRGKVMTREGEPLSGVTITALDHPEYGQTTTVGDGMFNMAVNGGGVLTLNYVKADFLPAQRQVNVPWQDYAHLPDVILLQLDPVVTRIDLTAGVPVQVARGSVSSDADGDRQATLLVPQGTEAELVMPDGSTQSITSLGIRATEYTVGDNGPEAMPAELPPTSFYTYCVELTADEVLAAGAGSVRFNEPLPFYVENFLGFPVGIQVPVGYYDFNKAAWVPSEDGRVIEILSVTGDLADVDSDGDSTPDDAATLLTLGITEAEQRKLGEVYAEGQSLWRVRVYHFTAFDCNYGLIPKEGATRPRVKAPRTRTNVEDNSSLVDGWGSIEMEGQVLREAIGIAGTPFLLHYSSRRTPGYGATSALGITLCGDTVPADAKSIGLAVRVAGRSFLESYAPSANLVTTFFWDGKDAFGREVQGNRLATVRIGYVYDGYYAMPAPAAGSFGLPSGRRIPSDIPARTNVTLLREYRSTIGAVGRWDARGQGLAGWTLDVHHSYHPGGHFLHRGDGRRRSAANMSKIIDTFVGGGWGTFGRAGQLAVAPDGSLYVTMPEENIVRRVMPDGSYETVAGTGEGGYAGDGGPATEAQLDYPSDIAIGPDGSLYIADTSNDVIRRVAPDAIITTVAGIGDQFGYEGDGGPATEAKLGDPEAVAVAPDGTIYIGDSQNFVIRRIAPDGIMMTVAGTGDWQHSGDGGPAIEAKIGWVVDILIGEDGSLYLLQADNVDAAIPGAIRRIGPDGIIETIAGRWGGSWEFWENIPATELSLSPGGMARGLDGSFYVSDWYYVRVLRITPEGVIRTAAGSGEQGYSGDGGPATLSKVRAGGLAVAPDGTMYISDGDNEAIRRVTSAFPGISDADILVPSEDGSRFYVFDRFGRHLETLHALTGATLLDFDYDDGGRLISITDRDGNVTTIERDANGDPTAIVAPFGQRTALTLNANSYLSSVANPAGDAVLFDYTDEGLLTSVTSAKGNSYQFTYSEGFLVKADDPAGGFNTITRELEDEGYEVTRHTAGGRVSRSRVETLPTGEKRRVNVRPDGTQSVLLIGAGGGVTLTQSNGTTASVVNGPDPRFGMQASLPTSRTVSSPGGLQATMSAARDVTLAEADNPLSLTSLTETITINGRDYTTSYSSTANTITDRTPSGRETITTLDDGGRVVRRQLPGLVPTTFAYNLRGNLANIVRGTGPDERNTAFGYNEEGRLATITDAIGRIINFSYSPAGQVTHTTLPGDRMIVHTYDSDGSLISITPPGRPAHVYTYTPVYLKATYTAPDVGEGPCTTTHTYNGDRRLTRITFPDGQTAEFEFDSGGRKAGVKLPGGRVSYAYDETAGNLMQVSAIDGGTVSYTYDGSVLTSTTWAGTVSGSVSRACNNDFRMTSLMLNGADPVGFECDPDGLVTRAGDLVLGRDAQSGRIASTSLGKISDSRTYNSFGEIVSYTASFDGTVIYVVEYTRDKLGRTTERRETVGGVTDIYSYAYHPSGALAEVRKNGEIAASYAYDANGNRVTYTGGGTIIEGLYDNQDRLTQCGSAVFTYGANGDLQSRKEGAQVTTYQYDILGSLRVVVLPDGRQIDYLTDGVNRRIGRKLNGVPDRGFLYLDGLRPVAELDGDSDLRSLFIYASWAQVPDYMIKGGTAYRILTDHLGSPRLVVNIETGDIVQSMHYDEFGRVTGDTNPGFQPFGFAGGLYDPDTGLVRFGLRDYDAHTGRWTAKDPLGFDGDSTNQYRYVLNDPVNAIDSYGAVETNPEAIRETLWALAHEEQRIGGWSNMREAYADVDITEHALFGDKSMRSYPSPWPWDPKPYERVMASGGRFLPERDLNINSWKTQALGLPTELDLRWFIHGYLSSYPMFLVKLGIGIPYNVKTGRGLWSEGAQTNLKSLAAGQALRMMGMDLGDFAQLMSGGPPTSTSYQQGDQFPPE